LAMGLRHFPARRTTDHRGATGGEELTRTQTIEARRPMRPAFRDAGPECEKAAAKVLVAVCLPLANRVRFQRLAQSRSGRTFL